MSHLAVFCPIMSHICKTNKKVPKQTTFHKYSNSPQSQSSGPSSITTNSIHLLIRPTITANVFLLISKLRFCIFGVGLGNVKLLIFSPFLNQYYSTFLSMSIYLKFSFRFWSKFLWKGLILIHILMYQYLLKTYWSTT